jgi:tyrosinase
MTMGLPTLFICVLAILPGAHFSYALEWNGIQPPKCSKLVARKEWRVLTSDEKADWVEAVKVRFTYPIAFAG